MEAGSTAPLRVIEPPTGVSLPSVRELWDHRDLMYLLARREVSARYKQSAIGVFWAVLQPLLLAVVFSVFFGHLAKVPSEAGVPVPGVRGIGDGTVAVLRRAMPSATTSTIANRELISKVYFPRVIIPIAAVVQPLDRLRDRVRGRAADAVSCTGSRPRSRSC